MDRIKEKVRTKGDDRYYTLGMALDLLDETWKDDVFQTDFSMEEKLAELVRP